MNDPLADALLTRCLTVTQIGKTISDNGGKHDAADAARIERLYFELGSLVLANIATITYSLNAAYAIKILMATPFADKDTIEKQVKELNNVDLSAQ